MLAPPDSHPVEALFPDIPAVCLQTLVMPVAWDILSDRSVFSLLKWIGIITLLRYSVYECDLLDISHCAIQQAVSYLTLESALSSLKLALIAALSFCTTARSSAMVFEARTLRMNCFTRDNQLPDRGVWGMNCLRLTRTHSRTLWGPRWAKLLNLASCRGIKVLHGEKRNSKLWLEWLFWMYLIWGCRGHHNSLEVFEKRTAVPKPNWA